MKSQKPRYIDSSGNELRRATYESLLAKNIVNHPEFWVDIFEKLNAKIVKILEYNTTNSLMRSELDRYNLTLHSAIKIYKGRYNKNDTFPNEQCFKKYKEIFERVLPAADMLPEDQKQLGIYDITYEKLIVDKAAKSFRTPELFYPKARGRIQLDSDESTMDAGILTKAATPRELKGKFVKPVSAGKYLFERYKPSPTIQMMEEYNIPFVGGPSGTFGFILAGVQALLAKELKENPENYGKFFMGLAACYVYSGHHSFAEFGMVINALRTTLPQAFVVDPTLEAKPYYDQLVTENYRLSDAYHQFNTSHNPNKYSAMTWEILFEAQYDVSRYKKEAPPASMTALLNFIKKHGNDHGEISPADLEQLRYILKDCALERDRLGFNKETASMRISEALLQAVEASGISPLATASTITWGQLARYMDPYTSNSIFTKDNVPLRELTDFVIAHAKDKGEIDGTNLYKLITLVNAIPAAPDDALLQSAKTQFKQKLPELSAPDKKDIYGFTPLMHAVEAGHYELAKAYLDEKADPAQATAAGFTSLHLAAKSGNVALVQLLLEYKAHINVRSNKNISPIEVALMYGHKDVVTALSMAGADPKHLMGVSNLYSAASKGRTASIEILSELKADWNQKNEDGVTPIMIAVQYGQIEALKLLIEKKADFKRSDKDGYMILHYAAMGKNIEILKALADLKADFNFPTKKDNPPLFVALQYSNLAMVKALIAQRGDLNHVTKEHGVTCIEATVIHGKTDILKFLLASKEYKQGLNRPDKHGSTPLRYAISNARWDLVVLLVLAMEKSKLIPADSKSTLFEDNLQPADFKLLRSNRQALTTAFIYYAKSIPDEKERNECVSRVVHGDNVLGAILNQTGSHLPSFWIKDRASTKKIDEIKKELKYVEPAQEQKEVKISTPRVGKTS